MYYGRENPPKSKNDSRGVYDLVRGMQAAASAFLTLLLLLRLCCFYSSNSVSPTHTNTQANNTLQQDRDKVYTLDSARLQYGHCSRVFLAVDCDEFLVPEGQHFTLASFREELLHKVFSARVLQGSEEMFLTRRSVPGAAGGQVLDLTDKLEHVKNFHLLTKCFLEGE